VDDADGLALALDGAEVISAEAERGNLIADCPEGPAGNLSVVPGCPRMGGDSRNIAP